MKSFYEPTAEHLEKLSGPWCASYSGGKDSTSLVTWIEWLRRVGWITVERPRLVRSDTGIEEIGLDAAAREITGLLEWSGWECMLVSPEIHERLYNRILGVGVPPIHPGIATMRWCTRSTKIDPMERGRPSGLLTLTGRREGESATRDKKMRRGCAAGGECGIPDPGENTYEPIKHWRECHVWDWLGGVVGKPVSSLMGDVFDATRRLADIYGVQECLTLFEEREVLSAARFGCVGCPAIGAEASAPRSVRRRYGAGSPLLELYDVWFEARRPENRLVKVHKDGRVAMGPIRLGVRRRLFERVKDIERRAGVTLIAPEDERFIRQCWEDKVYPRYSSADDEETEQPEGPLFAVETDSGNPVA